MKQWTHITQEWLQKDGRTLTVEGDINHKYEFSDRLQLIRSNTEMCSTGYKLVKQTEEAQC